MCNKEGYRDSTAEIAISRVYKEEMNKKKGGEKMGTRDSPTLKRVRRLDSIRLDRKDSTYFTEEGYLVDHPILTSCGIFEYANPDGSIRRELRLPKYVFDEDSLKTYKGKPIIITHDAGVVDKSNVDKEQVGTILTEGYQDGNDVRAEIIIHDTDAMKDSGLKELSLGYNLDLIEEPGVYDGEHYDAIQTNIVINHLAIVASARAGEQARLNIDEKDIQELKGGKLMRKDNGTISNESLSPEELQKAILAYKASKKAEVNTEDENDVEANEKSDEDETVKSDEDDTEGTTPEAIVEMVKEHKSEREDEDEPTDLGVAKDVITQQDSDIDMLLAAIEKLLAEKQNNSDSDAEEENMDEEDDGEGDSNSESESKAANTKTTNADSADKIIRQRLNICRVGDKLNLDGLENMSIKQAKKTIIAKVLPTMRVDGKSDAYIDAMYDLAVGEVKKSKSVAYQKQQMIAQAKRKRSDSNESMALSARNRMIQRTGGNE